MIEIETHQKSYKFTKSPSYLVLLIISINLLFGLAYIIVLIIEEMFETGSGLLANLGYDSLLIGMIIVQQIVYAILIWRRYSEIYTVSTSEIKHKKGIFVREKQEYSLKNMISMEIHKSFWGNILNYGNITISYVGSTSAVNKDEIFKVVIEKVSNPEYLISLMKEKL